jgi:hypothetical protein
MSPHRPLPSFPLFPVPLRSRVPTWPPSPSPSSSLPRPAPPLPLPLSPSSPFVRLPPSPGFCFVFCAGPPGQASKESKSQNCLLMFDVLALLMWSKTNNLPFATSQNLKSRFCYEATPNMSKTFQNPTLHEQIRSCICYLYIPQPPNTKTNKHRNVILNANYPSMLGWASRSNHMKTARRSIREIDAILQVYNMASIYRMFRLTVFICFDTEAHPHCGSICIQNVMFLMCLVCWVLLNVYR